MSDVFEHAEKNHLDKIIWIRLEFKQIVRDRGQWREKNNRKGDIMRKKNESNETLQPGNFEIQ